MTNGKIDVTQSARKVTLLGIAVLFFYLAYDAFTASGWEINDAFWMGIVMVGFRSFPSRSSRARRISMVLVSIPVAMLKS